MNPATESLNQRLAHYIFTVASQQIDSADPILQTAVIDLWRTVSGDTSTSHSSQPVEWEAVLQKPIDWHSVNQQWLQGIIRARKQAHATYVVRLEQAIASTHLHLEAVQNGPLSYQLRTNLTAYYQRTLLMYQQQLTRAERIHRSLTRR